MIKAVAQKGCVCSSHKLGSQDYFASAASGFTNNFSLGILKSVFATIIQIIRPVS